MILRTDHVAGAAAIAAGIAVWAVSGDLPVGRLSMPGAGMMPKLICCLMVFFGGSCSCVRGGRQRRRSRRSNGAICATPCR